MRLALTLVALFAWFLAAGCHDLLEGDHCHDDGASVYAGLVRTTSPMAGVADAGLQPAVLPAAPLCMATPARVGLVLDPGTVPRRGPPPHPASAPRAPPAGS